MNSAKYLKLLGPAHLLILAAVLLIAAGSACLCRRGTRTARWVRYGLAGLLSANELAWYAYVLRFQGFRFPGGLALDLCDITAWIAVFAACTLNPLAFDVVYYAVLAGSSMALLTPDLWMPLWTFPTMSFFISHGLAVATVLTLLWGKLTAPRPGSFWKVLLLLNAYAAAVGTFDAIFKTNYMYLRQKPAGASLLDYFGPWPFYLVAAEIMALLLFYLLWLPFRRKGSAPGVAPPMHART